MGRGIGVIVNQFANIHQVLCISIGNIRVFCSKAKESEEAGPAHHQNRHDHIVDFLHIVVKLFLLYSCAAVHENDEVSRLSDSVDSFRAHR